MSRDAASVDPAVCPLCAGDNRCGRLQGAANCWCEAVTFDTRTLDRVPAVAVRKACICEPCAGGSRLQGETARE